MSDDARTAPVRTLSGSDLLSEFARLKPFGSERAVRPQRLGWYDASVLRYEEVKAEIDRRLGPSMTVNWQGPQIVDRKRAKVR